MKKQGDFYLKLLSILLAVVIVAYVLMSVLLNSGSGYALETAVYCEVGDGLTVSGFVVRDETVLKSDAPIAVCELTEGAWVGGGQRVATGYQSGDARERREELNSLRGQREQLALAAGSDNANAPALDEQISELLTQLSAQTSQRRFDAMHATAAELEPLVLRRCVSGGELPQIEQRLVQIDERISELTAQSFSGATAIVAESSGYFSEQTDGLEAVLTPQALQTLTLADYRALSESAPGAPTNAIGRLITGQKWYFLTELPAERAAQCKTGDRLTVHFAAQELQGLRMRVERVGEETDGACLLVLSCERKLQEVTALRRQTVDIEFQTFEGLRVPKSALYHLGGKDGVYVLEGARAEWKEVTVLYEYGDSFLVEWDSSDTDHLWPKDELILTSDDITDGKVMQQ